MISNSRCRCITVHITEKRGEKNKQDKKRYKWALSILQLDQQMYMYLNQPITNFKLTSTTIMIRIRIIAGSLIRARRLTIFFVYCIKLQDLSHFLADICFRIISHGAMIIRTLRVGRKVVVPFFMCVRFKNHFHIIREARESYIPISGV